jgi:hypothetical protein
LYVLWHSKKTKGSTFSKHKGNKSKMQEYITSRWTKYYAPPATEESEEEELAVHGDNK